MSDNVVHSTHSARPVTHTVPVVDKTKKMRAGSASVNDTPQNPLNLSLIGNSEETIDHNFHGASHVVNCHLHDKHEEPHFIKGPSLLKLAHLPANKKNISPSLLKKIAAALTVVGSFFAVVGVLKLSVMTVATGILAAAFPPFAPAIIAIVIVCGLVALFSFAYLKSTMNDKKVIKEINLQDDIHEDKHIELSDLSQGVGLGVSSQRLADALTIEKSVDSTLSRLGTNQTKNFTASILKGYNEVVQHREQNLKKLISGIYEISDALTLDQKEKVMSGTSLLNVIDNRGLVAICPPNLTQKLDELNDIDPNFKVDVQGYTYDYSTRTTKLALTIKKNKKDILVDKIKVHIESQFKLDDAEVLKLNFRSKLNLLMNNYEISKETVISKDLFRKFLNEYITLVEQDATSNSGFFKGLIRNGFNQFHKEEIPDLLIETENGENNSISPEYSELQDSRMIKLLLSKAHPYFITKLLDMLDLEKVKEMTGVSVMYDNNLTQLHFETQLPPQEIKQKKNALKASEKHIQDLESELKQNINISPKQLAKLTMELDELKLKFATSLSSISQTSKIEKANLTEIPKVIVDKFVIGADVINKEINK